MIFQGMVSQDPPHNKEFWKEEYKLTAEHYCNFIIKLCEALDLKKPDIYGIFFWRKRGVATCIASPQINLEQ